MKLTNVGFKKALAVIFATHPQLEPKKNQELVYTVWHRALCDLSDTEVLDAVTRFVIETPKLYPGDNFIAMIRQLAMPVLQETEGDAVELAFEAARRFGYMREDEAMQWLQSKSLLIAAAVRRVGYRDLCHSDEPDVIRGQLRAVFKAEKERARAAGGIVESATHLNNGLPDNERLQSLASGVGKKIKALPEASNDT